MVVIFSFSTITSTTFGVVFLNSISLQTVISQSEPKLKVNSVLTPEYKVCRVLHFNIRSLKCHYDELLLFLSQTDCHLFNWNLAEW